MKSKKQPDCLLNLLPPGLVTIPTNYLVLLVCCTLLLENNLIAEQNVGFCSCNCFSGKYFDEVWFLDRKSFFSYCSHGRSLIRFLSYVCLIYVLLKHASKGLKCWVQNKKYTGEMVHTVKLLFWPYDFRINFWIVRNTLISQWFGMIGISISPCLAFGHVDVM